MPADLRLILLVVGIIVILAILLDGLRKRNERKIRQRFTQVGKDGVDDEMPLSIEPECVVQEKVEIKEESLEVIEDIPTQEAPSLNSQAIISLTILPNRTKAFLGKNLAAALEDNQFKLGKHNIFHQYLNHDPNQEILFSLASLTEPGNFDPDSYVEQTYRGLILFMVVPSVINPHQVFEIMVLAGRQLAISLNAYLYDDQRKTLTVKAIEKYREKIRQLIENSLTEHALAEG